MSDVENWQNAFKDNKSRAEYYLHNDILTDCKFLVGQESDEAVTIRGHKLILALASPVFERMFYGSFDEAKSDEVRIPDIKHNIFHMMMDYIYFEKLELVTVDDAFELYSAAKKYMLQNLMEMCINHLTANFNSNNIVKIYEFAVFFEEKELLTKSGDWIKANAVKVFEDPGFLDAKITTLIVLFRGALYMNSELDLFHALNKYALANGYFDTEKSVEKKEEESETEKKKLLREALKEIRFLRLKPEEFKIVVESGSGLLTDSELLSILLNIIYPDIKNHPMPEGFSNLKK